MTGAVLRFPGERQATFTCSFGSSDIAEYALVGTKGHLRLENAYEYRGELKCVTTLDGKKSEKIFPTGDQFAPELIYFSDCIMFHHCQTLHYTQPNETDGQRRAFAIHFMTPRHEKRRRERHFGQLPLPDAPRPAIGTRRRAALT